MCCDMQCRWVLGHFLTAQLYTGCLSWELWGAHTDASLWKDLPEHSADLPTWDLCFKLKHCYRVLKCCIDFWFLYWFLAFLLIVWSSKSQISISNKHNKFISAIDIFWIILVQQKGGGLGEKKLSSLKNMNSNNRNVGRRILHIRKIHYNI